MKNRGKRWMAMALAVIVTCVNFFILGGDLLEAYADGKNLEEFVIDENGVLTKYNGTGGDVVIPDGVTSIESQAFEGCTSLKSVNIPKGVTWISYNAFSGCSSLTSVTIPEGVTSIGKDAFSGCSSLTSITIPESVTNIGVHEYYGVYSSAFSGCSSLTSIIVDEKNTCYDSRENCNAIIETNTNALIAGCKNTNIPGSITSIEDSAFSGCSGLKSVTIPEGVTRIGYNAFRDCSSLTSITIPGSVTKIGAHSSFGFAFSGCSGLTSIIVNKENVCYDSRENCNAIIETKTNILVAGCNNTIIPEGVTSIGDCAFEGRSGLASVTIPGSVTNIGREAFSGCSSLTSVTILEGVTSIGQLAFSDCNKLTNMIIPKGVTDIGYGAFDDCSSLISVTIPEGVTSIGSFNRCSSLINVIIPESVTWIDDFTFSGCSSLASVTIPGSVRGIGDAAFSDCSSLASVIIPESVKGIGGEAFSGCSNLTSIKVDEKNTYYDSRKNCNAIIETNTNTLVAGCKNTIIPEGVISISYSAFSGCSGLKSVSIPKSVSDIKWTAFSDCSSLTSIKVDKENACYDSRENCNAIIETNTNTLVAGCKNTIIPESVTSIGAYAFYGCSSLTSLKIPKEVTSIGACAFDIATTLLVEEGSYAERYAKNNGYNYRTFSVYDATEKPILTKETVRTLIEKSANNDIVILANNGVEFTFAKGTMAAVEGLESYDFGTIVTTDFKTAALPDSVTSEEFVAKISYNYSGQLPGEASIKIFVGKGYVGKEMMYSLLKDDNTLEETQTVKVDSEGYITVKQSHCSSYVITRVNNMIFGDVNEDGNITAEDALSILKHVVGLELLTGDALTSADVNADSAITAEDALDVLKKVVGLIDKFVAEG